MSLINLLIVLVVIGVALYFINSMVPLDPKIRTIINVVVILFVVIWLLQVTGIAGPFIRVN